MAEKPKKPEPEKAHDEPKGTPSRFIDEDSEGLSVVWPDDENGPGHAVQIDDDEWNEELERGRREGWLDDEEE